MSFWVKNFAVPKVGWRVMHDGIPGLSVPEDFRAAEFDMEKKIVIFLDLRCRPLDVQTTIHIHLYCICGNQGPAEWEEQFISLFSYFYMKLSSSV